MEANKVEVNIRDLIELKDNLNNLSNTLHSIYEMMCTEMNRLGDSWRDSKYLEFVEGYKPQINKCEDISARYKEWCREIELRIEKVAPVENFDFTRN